MQGSTLTVNLKGTCAWNVGGLSSGGSSCPPRQLRPSRRHASATFRAAAIHYKERTIPVPTLLHLTSPQPRRQRGLTETGVKEAQRGSAACAGCRGLPKTTASTEHTTMLASNCAPLRAQRVAPRTAAHTFSLMIDSSVPTLDPARPVPLRLSARGRRWKPWECVRAGCTCKGLDLGAALPEVERRHGADPLTFHELRRLRRLVANALEKHRVRVLVAAPRSRGVQSFRIDLKHPLESIHSAPRPI